MPMVRCSGVANTACPVELDSAAFFWNLSKACPFGGAVVTSGSESKSSVFASGVGLLTHDYARSLKQYRKTKLGTLSFICALI